MSDFPDHLIRLGWAVTELWARVNRDYPLAFHKPAGSPSPARLRQQLEQAYIKAEESISSSSRSSYVRNVFLISLPRQVVRREVLLLISTILYLELADLGFHRSVGLVCRIVSAAMDDKETDAVGKLLLVRQALGDLLESAKGLTILEDESVASTRQFRWFTSMARVCMMVNLTHSVLMQHLRAEAEYRAKHSSEKPKQPRPLRRLGGRLGTQNRFDWKPGDKQTWN